MPTARILVHDPPVNTEIKLLMEFERGGGYRRKCFPSERELNVTLCRAIPSASASEIIEFTTHGLRSKGTAQPVPGKAEEWAKFFQ